MQPPALMDDTSGVSENPRYGPSTGAARRVYDALCALCEILSRDMTSQPDVTPTSRRVILPFHGYSLLFTLIDSPDPREGNVSCHLAFEARFQFPFRRFAALSCGNNKRILDEWNVRLFILDVSQLPQLHRRAGKSSGSHGKSIPR